MPSPSVLRQVFPDRLRAGWPSPLVLEHTQGSSMSLSRNGLGVDLYPNHHFSCMADGFWSFLHQLSVV